MLHVLNLLAVAVIVLGVITLFSLGCQYWYYKGYEDAYRDMDRDMRRIRRAKRRDWI